jgi:hypothetical protein
LFSDVHVANAMEDNPAAATTEREAANVEFSIRQKCGTGGRLPLLQVSHGTKLPLEEIHRQKSELLGPYR